MEIAQSKLCGDHSFATLEVKKKSSLGSCQPCNHISSTLLLFRNESLQRLGQPRGISPDLHPHTWKGLGMKFVERNRGGEDVRSLIYISYSKQLKIKLAPEMAPVKASPSLPFSLWHLLQGPREDWRVCGDLSFNTGMWNIFQTGEGRKFALNTFQEETWEKCLIWKGLLKSSPFNTQHLLWSGKSVCDWGCIFVTAAALGVTDPVSHRVLFWLRLWCLIFWRVCMWWTWWQTVKSH